MKCLSKALSRLLQRNDVEEYLAYYRPAPWCGADVIYAARNFGAHLLPLAEKMGGVKYPSFDDMYQEYDGILCGDLPDGRQHAYAKVGHLLHETNGSTFSLFGDAYEDMENRVFFAWVNKPALRPTS